MKNRINTKNKIKQGLSWTSLDLFTKSIVQFFIQLTLAKFLVKEEFGVITISLILTNFIKPIIDLGLTHAIIQSTDKKNENNILSSAFNVLIIYNFFLLILITLSSFVFVEIFGNVIFYKVIPVSAIFLIFSPFTIINEAYLSKKMMFNSIGRVNIISNVLVFISIYFLLAFDFGIWAMILYNPILFFSSSFLYLFTVKNFLVLSWDIKHVKKILNFGLNTTGSKIVNAFYSQFDYFIVGKILNETILGLYSFSFQLTSILKNSFISITAKVLYPVYSKFQNDITKVKKYYSYSVKCNLIILGYLILFLILFSEELLVMFYGNKWLESVQIIKILSLASLIQVLVSSNTSLIRSLGYPKLEFKIQSFKVFVIFIPTITFLTYYYGVMGTSVAVLSNSVFSVFIALYFLNRLINYSLINFLLDVGKPTIVLILTFVIMTYLNYEINMFIKILIFSLIYILLTIISSKRELILIFRGED